VSDESIITTRPSSQVTDIEFCLMYETQPFTSGFIDTITLELSEGMKAVPEREKRARDILCLVGSPDFKGSIPYFPHHMVTYKNEFYTQRHGRIYVADLEHVARVTTRLIQTLDEIMDHRNSLCRNIRVEGLEYFNGLRGERIGKFFVPEGPENEFSAYSTTYDEGMNFRRWVARIDQQTSQQKSS
jgi:hypothetical protein